jgi:taurine dioxygenase
MHERALQPVGVEVSGLDLDAAGPDDVDHLQNLLARHGVVIMRGQDVDDPAFLGFLRRFGELAVTTGEPPLPGYPDLNLVSNVGRTTPPRSTFHVDTSYVRHPPAYTALRAVRIPAQGGETLFTNQYRAYDTLPADVRERLRGRTIRHEVTGLDLGPDDETAAEHPVFRPHPISGRTALYLSTPQRCTAISGLDDAAAREMIDFLFAHSTAADNTYWHAWSTGDVVMWDNGCVLHRADHDGVVGDRVLHRGMVARYPVSATTGARA